MMRKIIASFTVIVYFTFACGVMVNYHYCMDRYHSFSLYQPGSDKCATCGMHSNKRGCCHNEVKIVKIQNSYQTTSALFSFKAISPAVSIPAFLSASLLREEISSGGTTHPPPLLTQQDTYLQNCVFRI